MSSKPLWLPSEADLAASRLLSFARTCGLDDVAQMRSFAEADPGRFWSAAWDDLGLEWTTPPKASYAVGEGARGDWFPGGFVDPVEVLVSRWVHQGRGTHVAVSSETENGRHQELTFDGLLSEVSRVAGGLAGLGARDGQRVALMVPMSIEAVVALVACASIGAVAVPLFSGLGAPAAAERLRQCDARILIGSSGYWRRGKWVDSLEVAREVTRGTPSLTQVVLTGDDSRALGRRELHWNSLESQPFQPVPRASDSTMILAYTSGTTGAPKGVALPSAGFLVKAGSDVAWLMNVGRGSTASWVTDPGWIMAQIIMIGTLVSGGRLALIDGAPDWPNFHRLWDFVERQRVTMLGVSPTLVRMMMAAGDSGAPKGDVSSLQVLAGSGEAWSDESFEWLFERVGKGRIPVINYSGGTEVSGAILSNSPAEAVHVADFAGPAPGMGADVVDDAGKSKRMAVGELVLRHSSPGMATTFWGDHGRYLETYWSDPSYWRHGDWSRIDGDGRWKIEGRSDDTIKLAGKRLGPGEIEAIALQVPQVIDAVAVGVTDAVRGQALAVVVTCTARGKADSPDGIAAAVAAAIEHHLGRAFRPKHVVITSELPRTRSGKLMRRSVRAIIEGGEVGDTGAMANPEALDAIRDALAAPTGESK